MLKVNVDSDGVDMTRTFSLTAKGDVVCVNDYFRVDETGGGKGTKIFADQVEACAFAGVKEIQTHAARGSDSTFNGYYTWPRLGYDQDLGDISPTSSRERVLAKQLQEKFPSAEKVSDLMKTKEGRDFWKAKGVDLHDATFDLREGSFSRKVLSAYLEEKGKKNA